MHKEPERIIRSRIEGLLFRISTIPPQYGPHYEEELIKYQVLTGKPYRTPSSHLVAGGKPSALLFSSSRLKNNS